MITTYLSSTDAELYYPESSGTSNYSAALKALALKDSFGLVNRFIESKYRAPIIGDWDGESSTTSISELRIAQSRFYRWILEYSNIGESVEAKDVFNGIVDFCNQIRQKQIDMGGATYPNEVGWNITEITQDSNIGGIQIRGSAPLFKTHYLLTVTSTGTNYVGDGALTFTVTRDDTATARETDTVATYDWQQIDSAFDIRWSGRWKAADTVQITGIPYADVNAGGGNTDTIKQGLIIS